MKKRRTSTSPPPPSQVSPPSSPAYESPPAAQPLPWEFDYSPASPPLTEREEEEEETAPPPTLYVYPVSSVLLTADGGSVRIPERSADQPETSTRQTESPEETPEVCDILIEEGVGNLIVYNLHRSQLSLDEVTKRTCQDITAMMLSPEWQNELIEQITATKPGLSKVV